MKKIASILFALWLCSFAETAVAQRFFLEYNLGYGTFGMSQMRDLLLTEGTVKGTKITDDFPGYLTQDIKFGYSDVRWDCGLQFAYLSTGGKKSLADYSGKYNEEIRNRGFKIGVFGRYCLLGHDLPLKLYAQLSAGPLYTKSKMTQKLLLNEVAAQEDATENLWGVNLFVQPAFVIQYHLIKPLALQAQIGYEWSPVKGDMHFEGNKIPLNADWDGLRAGLGVVLYLTR